MRIGIASDHHGVAKRKKLCEYLKSIGYEVVDFGPVEERSVDYPLFAFSVAESIRDNEIDCGILMCGTGIGMSIAANKVKGIRCARVTNKKDAMLCKEHNHANMIAFSANLSFRVIKNIVNAYLKTSNSIEERHIKRVNMIDEYNG